MQIRRMELKDVDRVSQLEEMAFSMPWHKESFIEMIQNPAALYMVAEEDEKPVAVCGILTVLDEGDISNVVVDPQYRRNKIASELLKAAMDAANKEYGTNAFTLEVRISNEPAIKLYEKLGFVSEGVRPKFYEKPVEDALIMWRR